MKNLKKTNRKFYLALTLAGLLSVLTGISQCPTSLTGHVITNGYYGDITIEPAFDVTPASGKIIYTLTNSFNSYTLTSTSTTDPQTFYNVAGGTYTLCLNADSLSSGCSAIKTCSLLTSNVPICNASFTYHTDSNCVTHFINTSTGPSLVYTWEIDGQYYYARDVDVSLPDGNYMVSMINNAVVDTSIGAFVPCDTVNQLISVACVPALCQANASFYISADTAVAGNFYVYNQSTGTGTSTYFWDFGDGTTSTLQHPVHQYAIPGHYRLCFTITATGGGTLTCSDSQCDSSSIYRMSNRFLMNQITVVPTTVTATKEESLIKHIKTYPNPIHDNLTILLELYKPQNDLIYHLADAYGRIIINDAITGDSTTIHTSQLPQGFYILSILTKDQRIIQSVKLLK